MGAHAATLRWMPPVLHISLGKLAARGKQEVLADEAGLGVDKRHHVLQLITKIEGPPDW